MKFFRIIPPFILILVYSNISAQAVEDSASLVKQAVELNNAGKYAGAAEKYNQALKIEPENIYANYGIAFSLLQLNKGDDAIPNLEKVITRNSSLTVVAYDLLGSIYDKDHNSAKAIAAFNAGIKNDPKYQRQYYNLALVYFRDKNYPEAERCVIQAIKLDSSHAASQRVYALVCFHQNKRANALLAFCSFILLEPHTARSAEAFGNIQHILAGGVLKQEVGTQVPVNTADDVALNLAITKETVEAEKKKYFTQADLLTAQLAGIFNAIGPLAGKQNGNDFFRKYYADYFYNLAQSGNTPAFAHLISGNTAESAEWIKNNAQQVAGLDNWVKTTARAF